MAGLDEPINKEYIYLIDPNWYLKALFTKMIYFPVCMSVVSWRGVVCLDYEKHNRGNVIPKCID